MRKDGIKDIFKEAKPRKDWIKVKEAVHQRQKHAKTKTQLNFTNLLKEEQLFLDKIAQMESFNFEEDFKFKGKRVRDSKVMRFYTVSVHLIYS